MLFHRLCSVENLAPKSQKQILEARSQLKLENDFVVGAFARYEMFSELLVFC